MSDYDYGDDEHGEEVDSDDDLAFVPAKRRYAYTTFDKEDEQDVINGKEEATYGSFLYDNDRPYRRKRARTSSSGPTPMFVKGETLENDVPMQDEPTNNVKQKEAETSVETPEDEEAKREEQARKERQEEANARFQALLGRGRGDDKSKRSMFRDEQKPSDGGDASLNGPVGLGFTAASDTAESHSKRCRGY